ncbi:DNA-directed DNA polymerase [Candidatus Woesearchaeota archaeon]|nr:DNA-directed DNA polymerase [Candidatus Woesearchaeota archaeon]
MAEKIQFFPIDVTYKVINGKAVIYIFGKTIDGKQLCVTDESFLPYFYVIPRKGFELREKIEKLKVGEGEEISEVVKTEIVNKKYLGKEVEAIKVFTKLPKDVPIIRDVIKNWEMIESINEYDILFIRRYLIDKNIVPLTLCLAAGEFVNQKSKVPVLKAESVEHFSDDTLTKPRILAFDIETYNPLGKSVMPEKNPIIMIAFYGDGFQKVITWKRFKTDLDYIEFVDSEAKLIGRIKEVIEEYKPDILTGYFSDGFDFPYIRARASKYKIKLELSLDYSELKLGKNDTAKIKGIAHVDVFKFIKRIMRIDLDTEVYGLNNVAAELLDEKKIDVDLDKLAEVWDNEVEKIEEYCRYNLHDSILTYKLCEKMLPSIIEFVKIVGLPIYDINRMGFSQLVEWYLLKQAPSFNEIAPNKPHYNEIGKRKLQTYRGAFVYEPEPGLYNDIAVFDFRSLYPTIIGSHNISPAMLNCDCCKGKEVTPTEEKYWFCTKKKGFIPTMIEELITRRMRIKEMMKEETNVFLGARQNSLKLLANSFYGYLGFFAARWYSIECAKSVTAYGRFYIQKVIDKAKAEGFKVLYSDTDSIFLSLKGKSKKDAQLFSEAINVELPGLMELEYEGFYPRGIFVSAKIGPFGAKKKYALISEDGTIKIKGFETVRRNWSAIAKEVQENVLKIILKEHDKEKAFGYVKGVITDLRNKKVAIEKVIITTQLQKEIKSYDAIGPHVAIAQKLKNKGVVVGPGSMINYVVTQGKDRIRDRAKLPEEVKADEYDADYYINNQVVPAVEKIFEVIGYSKEDLVESKHQKKLDKFFG